MTNKEKYKQHCIENNTIPIFLTYSWMNTIASDDNWDVVLKDSGEAIQGFIVYYCKTKLGQKYITMPHLTPYSGLWINYPFGQKTTTKISYERKISEELINLLPKVDFTVLHLYPSITNWQPFYWKDYKQTTRYTYIIENETNENLVYKSFKENVRREIKKAEKSLAIGKSEDISILHKLKEKSTLKSDEPLSYSLAYLTKIFNELKENCKLLIAKKDGVIISAILLISDNNTNYYLSGVVLPEFKTSGALSLLLWEAIKTTIMENKTFNFEGSMIKPIERFFSSFGAVQVPYHRITKTNSITSKTKELFKGI